MLYGGVQGIVGQAALPETCGGFVIMVKRMLQVQGAVS
jgi:hypothetical protein